ncbi:MAG: NAD-dependent epimerase/dehydratase family protein [Deltaproteobacteria bacterium]|nr:NAD-dependent epimerase/dehydratase family protein [Deltaproteobacteria bacterium]
MQVSRVFVTGGSGYVGRNLIRALVASGVEVVALARSEASAAAVAALGARPCRGDVLDRAALVLGMHGCDAVVHAAADTDHGRGSAAQDRINILGTTTVFEAARAAGVRRAIQISTEAVLADGRPLHQVDETHPIPARHAGNYSRTKALAEQAALAQHRDGLEVIVLRPRFVWGRDDSTALPQLVAAARAKKLVWIDGGRYLTSTTHVANLARAVELALASGRGGEIYFVTDGEPVPFRDFVEQLLATRGVAAPTRAVPRWLVRVAMAVGGALAWLTRGRVAPPISRQEYGTVAHEMTIVDAKIRRELGYAPVVSRQAGLAELRA